MARLTNLPVQQYRGTAAKTDAYTGPEGELTVTTDSHGLRIHDGAKKGGHAVAMAVQKILAGDGISVVGGTLGVDNTIAVKPATEDALGGLIVGKNLDVNADGTVSTKDWTAAVDELNADTGAALAPLLYDTAFVNVPGETATVIGRAIGELAWTLLPVRAAGFQLLDGSLIYSTGIYAAFYNYMVQLKNTGEHDNLFITETAWQQSITQYGVCGKFVLDTTAGTVRIPKVTGHVEGTIDKNAVGDLIEAGLPNITGGFSTNTHSDAQNASDNMLYGAFTRKPASTKTGVLKDNNQLISCDHGSNYLDASLSSPIYRDDINTVQTQSIKGYVYIIVGTYAKSDLQVNIDNVATDVRQAVTIAQEAYDKAGMVELKGTRTTTGDWTITGLTVGKPLYILMDDNIGSGQRYFFIGVVSGGIGGCLKNEADSPFLVGKGESSCAIISTDVFVTIPTSTTVVLRTQTNSTDVAQLYAYQ